MFIFLLFVFFLMIRRPPRSTQSRSSAASDVYKRQAEHSSYEFLEYSLQICERDTLVDDETFDLREHGSVACIHRVAAIASAGGNHPYRRTPSFHRPDLNRRRMCTQKHAGRQVERVLHIARGVVRGDVERLEIVVFLLDFWTLFYIESHGQKDGLDLLLDLREDMFLAGRHELPRQGKIDVIPVRRGRQIGQFLLDSLHRPLLECIDLLAELSALVLGHTGDLFEQCRDCTLLSQVLDLCISNVLSIASGSQPRLQVCTDFVYRAWHVLLLVQCQPSNYHMNCMLIRAVYKRVCSSHESLGDKRGGVASVEEGLAGADTTLL